MITKYVERSTIIDETIADNTFLWCKELATGMMKRDFTVLNLPIYTFDAIVEKIQKMTYGDAKALGVDAVIFNDGCTMDFSYRRNSEVYEEYSTLSDLGELVVTEFLERERRESRYFADLSGLQVFKDFVKNLFPTAAADSAIVAYGHTIAVDVLENDASGDDYGIMYIESAELLTGYGTIEIRGHDIVFTPGEEYADIRIGDAAEVNIFYQVGNNLGRSSTGELKLYVLGTFIDGTENPYGVFSFEKNELKAGDFTKVKLTFSEAVPDFTTSQVIVSNGILTDLVTVDGGLTYEAVFIPELDVEDMSNTLQVAGEYYSLTGKLGLAFSSGNFAIDTKIPTGIATLNPTKFKIGEKATLLMEFSERVYLDASNIISPYGDISGLTTLNGGKTWSAIFTPKENSESLENIITVSGYVDLLGNVGESITTDNYVLDTKAPTVSIGFKDSKLKAGVPAQFSVAFSEKVKAFTKYALSVTGGTVTTLLTNDYKTWVGMFTPSADFESTEGLITLGSNYTDMFDNVGSASLGGTFAVDTIAPTATITIDKTFLKFGDTANVEIVFSEPVYGFTTDMVTAENSTLTPFVTADNITWTSILTPNTNIEDTENIVSLAPGYYDIYGTQGQGVSGPKFSLDTNRPIATVSLSKNNLKIGDTAIVTVSFSSPVTGFNNLDVIAPNGNLTTFTKVDALTYTAVFTPSVGIESPNNKITITGGFLDASGNSGVNSTSENYAIDTIAPKLKVSFDAGFMTSGNSYPVTFLFSEKMFAFDNSYISATGGTISPLTSTNNTSWSGFFTPITDVYNSASLISVIKPVKDLSGNPILPNIEISNSTTSAKIELLNPNVKAGETTTVKFTFSNPVYDFASANINVPGGSISNISTTDNITWTATFTPTPDVTVTDGEIVLEGGFNVTTSTMTGVSTTWATCSGEFNTETQTTKTTNWYTNATLTTVGSTSWTTSWSNNALKTTASSTSLTTSWSNLVSKLTSNSTGLTTSWLTAGSASTTSVTNKTTTWGTGEIVETAALTTKTTSWNTLGSLVATSAETTIGTSWATEYNFNTSANTTISTAYETTIQASNTSSTTNKNTSWLTAAATKSTTATTNITTSWGSAGTVSTGIQTSAVTIWNTKTDVLGTTSATTNSQTTWQTNVGVVANTTKSTSYATSWTTEGLANTEKTTSVQTSWNTISGNTISSRSTSATTDWNTLKEKSTSYPTNISTSWTTQRPFVQDRYTSKDTSFSTNSGVTTTSKTTSLQTSWNNVVSKNTTKNTSSTTWGTTTISNYTSKSTSRFTSGTTAATRNTWNVTNAVTRWTTKKLTTKLGGGVGWETFVTSQNTRKTTDWNTSIPKTTSNWTHYSTSWQDTGAVRSTLKNTSYSTSWGTSSTMVSGRTTSYNTAWQTTLQANTTKQTNVLTSYTTYIVNNVSGITSQNTTKTTSYQGTTNGLTSATTSWTNPVYTVTSNQTSSLTVSQTSATLVTSKSTSRDTTLQTSLAYNTSVQTLKYSSWNTYAERQTSKVTYFQSNWDTTALQGTTSQTGISTSWETAGSTNTTISTAGSTSWTTEIKGVTLKNTVTSTSWNTGLIQTTAGTTTTTTNWQAPEILSTSGTTSVETSWVLSGQDQTSMDTADTTSWTTSAAEATTSRTTTETSSWTTSYYVNTAKVTSSSTEWNTLNDANTSIVTSVPTAWQTQGQVQTYAATSATTQWATNCAGTNTTAVTNVATSWNTIGTDTDVDVELFSVDTEPPFAVITMSDYALKIGETAEVMIIFSEEVTNFNNSIVTVENGTLSTFMTLDSMVWTATFTPNSNTTSMTNVITLYDNYTDLKGNRGAQAISDNYIVDTVRPTATITLSDDLLKVGDTSVVTIKFSEAVADFYNSDVTAPNGTLSNFVTADSITWVATFTPTQNILDETNVITLANTYTDLIGNQGTGAVSANYKIDTRAVSATITMSDSALKIGETSIVTITFNKPVTGFANNDVTVENGSITNFVSNDNIVWTAIFTPYANIEDTTNIVSLANTYTDTYGNVGTAKTSGNYTVDTKVPTATITLADSVLTRGETSVVTVVFSEPVIGFTKDDIVAPNGTLSNFTSSDSKTWTATFTPDTDVADSTNALTLNNTYTDVAGNTGTSTTSTNYSVDTTQPSAVISLSDTALKIGESAMVTITFNKAVLGFSNADVTAQNGTLSTFSSANGGVTWSATFTPTAGIESASNYISLASTYTDVNGNVGTAAISPVYSIDTKAPTAAISLSRNTFKVGDTAVVTITFSEPVTGFTNADVTAPNGSLSTFTSSDNKIWTATFTPDPQLVAISNITLANTYYDIAGNQGSGATSANYSIDTESTSASITISDTSLIIGETAGVTITFNESVLGFTNADLTVEKGTLSTLSTTDNKVWRATFTPTQNIEDTTNLITLTGAYTDAFGNPGATASSQNYAVDTKAPTAVFTLSSTLFKVGETGIVTLTFSEEVTNFSKDDVTVQNGTLSNFTTSNGIVWNATFTPTANVFSATNKFVLNPTYTDIAGNTGITAQSANYAVDTKAPTATITMSNVLIKKGATSVVTITFSEAVSGFTNSDVTVQNGTLSTFTTSNNITWTATFTPIDNISVAGNVISLSTGYTDTYGNAPASVTYGPAYTIDTQAPTATITMSDQALSIGETSIVTITFSEAVKDFTNSDVTVQNGTLTAFTTTDNIVWKATFTPSTNISDTTNVITLGVSTYTDNIGNIGSGATSENYTISTQVPTASIAISDNSLKIGETSIVTITFSEPVTGFSNADVTVQNGVISNFTSADNKVWTATFTPITNIEDSTNIVTLSGSYTSIATGNTGTGATSVNYAIDTKAPTATITMGTNALAQGQSTTVTITFSEAVSGFANADVIVENGTLSTFTTSNNITWTATFTPADAVIDTSNIITLNSSYTDLLGNSGTVATSQNYAIDTRPPVPSGNFAMFYGSMWANTGYGNYVLRVSSTGAKIGNETAAGTNRGGNAGAAAGSNGVYYGGQVNNGTVNYSSLVTVLNNMGMLVTAEKNVGGQRHEVSGAPCGGYMLGYGGIVTSTSYTNSLLRLDSNGNMVGTQTSGGTARFRTAGAAAGSTAVYFGGTKYSSASGTNKVTRFNSGGTLLGESANPSSISAIASTKYGASGAGIGSNAVYMGGYTGGNYSTRINSNGALVGADTVIATTGDYLLSATVGSLGFYYGGTSSSTNILRKLDANGALVGAATSISAVAKGGGGGAGF